jgi:hypothetical protein
MVANAWLTEAECADRLHISVRTFRERCAEASVRGIKPGRERLITEADFQTVVAYLDRRATSRTPRTPPAAPVDVRRALARSETQRLARRVPRPRSVTSLALERGDKDG